MWYYSSTIQSQARPCTPSDFERIIDSALVKERCEAMARRAEQMPERPTDEEWAKFKDDIKPYKQGDKIHILSLPGFCFHASFPNGRRVSSEAVPSGLVSLDLDHIRRPEGYFKTIKDDAIDAGLVLAYVSPSSLGLKLVFTMPEDAHSLKEGQEILIKKLGVEKFADTATSDYARLSFASSRDQILYWDEEELFAEHPLPVGFITKADEQEAKNINASKESNEPLPENIAEKKTYMGFTYKQIIEKLCVKLCGATEPKQGQRHTIYLKAARCLRTICDDDYDLMLSVLPQWGQEPAKNRATLKYVLARPQYDSQYKVMEDIIENLRREKALQEGETEDNLFPEVPRQLPPPFREYAKVTPKDLQPAFFAALLPMLGTYCSGVKVNVNPEKAAPSYLTPSFTACIVAPPASGKGKITGLRNRIMGKLLKLDKENLAKYSEWQQNHTKESYKGEEPKNIIYNLPEKLSNTSLSKQMYNAKGRHVFMFTPEIDALSNCNGSGAWSDLSVAMRKASDNDSFGQIYMSSDSFSCVVDVYLNMLMLGQPQAMFKFFNNANLANGMVDRALIVPLPDTTGMEEEFIRQMSEKDKERIDQILDYMLNVGKGMEPDRVEVFLPKTKKALKKWLDGHRENYLKTQENYAEDHFMRRARQTGFKTALVGYVASDMKETAAVVRFAEYMAELDLRMHMRFFGKQYNELHKKNSEIMLSHNSFASYGSYDLFADLPETFTKKDMDQREHEHNISDTNPYQKIARWREHGWIKQIGTGKEKTYKKIG